MSLEACLPAALRGPSTTITSIGDGASGAGVYRVESAGQAFVLKTAPGTEPLADWYRKLRVRQLAASAGLAPPVIHVDEARRAILSAFVEDRSFPALYMHPETHGTAVAKLGQTLRRLHALPPPADVRLKDPRKRLATTWSELGPAPEVPTFVGDAVGRVLSEELPSSERAPVLSHDDVHPANFVFDGENILLLDWETAGLNDPYFDLATIALFLRMDEGACLRLLAAYEGAPASELPARFSSFRRLVAVLCGTTFLQTARQSGHTGASGTETLDSAPSLAELYVRMQSGAVSLATAEGRWMFGLALVKESMTAS